MPSNSKYHKNYTELGETYQRILPAQSYFAVQTRKQEIIEDKIRLIEQSNAREKLKESEKRLSQNIYERGIDDAGFGGIRSKGDQALLKTSPPAEDLKKLKRRVKKDEKKLMGKRAQ